MVTPHVSVPSGFHGRLIHWTQVPREQDLYLSQILFQNRAQSLVRNGHLMHVCCMSQSESLPLKEPG